MAGTDRAGGTAAGWRIPSQEWGNRVGNRRAEGEDKIGEACLLQPAPAAQKQHHRISNRSTRDGRWVWWVLVCSQQCCKVWAALRLSDSARSGQAASRKDVFGVWQGESGRHHTGVGGVWVWLGPAAQPLWAPQAQTMVPAQLLAPAPPAWGCTWSATESA